MNQKEEERQEAITELQNILHVGDTVYTIMKYCSRSGMMRHISLFVIRDGEPYHFDHLAAKALNWPLANEGVKVSGCGMDMGFHLVYSVSATVFSEGFECIDKKEKWSENCPSNDHFNGDRNYEPHHHKSGGYALRQKWI